jgi:uncharacterized protein
MSIQARTDAVSPHELARKGGQFSGEIPLAAFPRLKSLVLGDGSVAVELGFTRDDEGRSRVRGRAAFSPLLQCQRCLEPVVRKLDVAIDLCVVRSEEQAAELAERVDTVLLAGEDVSIVDLVEDDLLLGLPNQVCKAYDACPNRPELNFPAADAAEEKEPAKQNPFGNPFGVLAGLKNRGK